MNSNLKRLLPISVALLLAAVAAAYPPSGHFVQPVLAGNGAYCINSPSHDHCSSFDPEVEGCAPYASTVANQSWPSAGAQTTINLDTRWSNPCSSNWSRVWMNPPTGACAGAYIQSDAYPWTNDDPYGYERYDYSGGCNGNTIWSPMLFAPTWHAQACGILYVNDQTWQCNYPM